MKKFTATSLMQSLSILMVSSFGGSAITWKLAGRERSFDFLYFSLTVALVMFFLQLCIYKKSQNQLFFELLYMSSVCLVLMWFVLSISLPIFWMQSINQGSKSAIAIFFAFISVSNIIFGYTLMNKKWLLLGKFEFDRLFDESSNAVEWSRVINVMNIKPDIFLPGVPVGHTQVTSIVLIGSMLAGINFRNVFPAVSVFAWGVPSIIFSSFFLQMSCYILSQAKVVKMLQEKKGVKIKSAVDFAAGASRKSD